MAERDGIAGENPARNPSAAEKCAICGTSLLDKPRIADLCTACDFNVSDRGDMSIIEPESGEDWKS